MGMCSSPLKSYKGTMVRCRRRSSNDMIAGAQRRSRPPTNANQWILFCGTVGRRNGRGGTVLWGRGRPGCISNVRLMADELLWKENLASGPSVLRVRNSQPHVFDIHGGGWTCKFPAHEDEIDPSCCANGHRRNGRATAHNEDGCRSRGKKMSKSLAVLSFGRDLLEKGVAGEVIRFVMSAPLSASEDWTEKKRDEAENFCAMRDGT